MGVLRLFSSGGKMKCNTKKGKCICKEICTPDIKNYKIIKKHEEGRYLILKINYTTSKNYEGNKILVFEDCTIEELVKQGSIDPHFGEKKAYKYPIARFAPTKEGWMNALIFAEA